MAKLAELKALAADLRKRLRQVDQLTGRSSERDRDASRKRQLRTATKEVQIPLCEDPERRILLESDDTEWLVLLRRIVLVSVHNPAAGNDRRDPKCDSVRR